MRSTLTAPSTINTTKSTATRVLNVALWILQVLMALLFFWHGQLMAFPPAEMVDMMNASMGQGLRLFIGWAEIFAALGLIAPSVTRILPQLTAWAAAGLMIVMASATVFHIARGENTSAISAAVIFVLISLVAYGRWKTAPITPRNLPLTHA